MESRVKVFPVSSRLFVSATVVALVACSSGTNASHGKEQAPTARGVANARPDCSVFEAMRRGKIPAKAPTDPAQFWMDFETCYAKGDSYCERAWILLTAMPSMASPSPQELAKQRAEYLGACSRLPAPVQRCLTAYSLAHPKECEPLHAHEQLNAAMGSGHAPSHGSVSPSTTRTPPGGTASH